MVGENLQWSRFSTCGCREGAQGSLEKDWSEVITENLHAELINLGIWSCRYSLASKSRWIVNQGGKAHHSFFSEQPTIVCSWVSEVSYLLNERPIGVKPRKDLTINVLTPNSFLLGWATASNILGWQPYETNTSSWYHLVHSVVEDFWKRCTELYAPTRLVKRKWHIAWCNLHPGDVVIVADKNTLRGDYRLELVKEVFSKRKWKSAQSGYSGQ